MKHIVPFIFAGLLLNGCIAPVSSEVATDNGNASEENLVSNGDSSCSSNTGLKNTLANMGNAKIGSFSVCDTITHAGASATIVTEAALSSSTLFALIPKNLSTLAGRSSLALGAAYYTTCATAPLLAAWMDKNEQECNNNNTKAAALVKSYRDCTILRSMYPDRKSWFTDWCPSVHSGATYCVSKSVLSSQGKTYFEGRELKCLVDENSDQSGPMFSSNDEVIGYPAQLKGRWTIKSSKENCLVPADSLACSF